MCIKQANPRLRKTELGQANDSMISVGRITPDRVGELAIPKTVAKSEWIVVGVLAVFSVFTLVYPVARAFYHLQIDYNEGWNVYHAQTAMHHLPLYYPKYGWTTVNYPMLSFYIVGYFSRFLGNYDYLLAGRVLSLISLLLCCMLVCLIVRTLTNNWAAAIFGASFCLALFCAKASFYVGADDPQMLGQPFLLAGLLLYLLGPPRTVLLGLIAFLFVLGGNIKHNLLAIPISVAVDLLLISRGKAVRFLLFSAIFLGLSIVFSVLVGGPFFTSKILTPRVYSLYRAVRQFVWHYGLLQLPLVIAFIWSVWNLQNARFRAISLYFFVSLILGLVFSGGHGVAINAFFDNFLAISIIVGVCLDYGWRHIVERRWRFAVPVLLYSSVFFVFGQSGSVNLPLHFSQLRESERRFEAEVSFLAAQPGPAICESMLRCYYAGKPFLYDPFNSSSLVSVGKLDSKDIVDQIAQKRYGAIQTELPVSDFPRPNDRFPDDVLNAITRSYTASWRDQDCIIYVPRPEGVPRK